MLEANEKYMDATVKVHVLMYVLLMDCYVFSTSSLMAIVFLTFSGENCEWRGTE